MFQFDILENSFAKCLLLLHLILDFPSEKCRVVRRLRLIRRTFLLILIFILQIETIKVVSKKVRKKITKKTSGL